MMNEVIKVGSRIFIYYEDFNPGHWLNITNNMWIKRRIYVHKEFYTESFIKSVEKMNKKMLEKNIEIILK